MTSEDLSLPVLPADKPSVILFDWDGTLVDSQQWLLSLHNRVRARMGEVPWTDDEYRFFMHYSSRDHYPVIFGDRAQEAMDVLQDELKHDKREGLAPIPGAQALLDVLQARGIRLGLVSNKSHAGLMRDVVYYDWNAYFMAIVGAGRALRDKPAPDPAMMALHEMGYSGADVPTGADCWFVGDTDTDVDCAEAAGFYTVVLGARPRDPKLGARYATLEAFAAAIAASAWY